MRKLFKASKRKKNIIAFTLISISAIYFSAINVFAHYYDKFPAELFDHLIKRTWIKDLGRTIMWHILCCFGRIIDYFEEAVNAIVNFNMTKLFERITGYTDLNPVVPMVFSIFLILGACFMMIFPNKIKVKDYLKGIIVSALLIIALPVFIDSMGKMKEAGTKDVETMKTTNSNSSGIQYSIGDELLQHSVIDVQKSVNQITYYSSNSPSNLAEQVYYLNIQEIIDWDPNSDENYPGFRYEIKSSKIASDGQNRFEELTYENRASLLGLGEGYNLLVQMRSTLKPDETALISDENNSSIKHPMTAKEYERHLIVLLCANKDIQEGAYPEDKPLFTWTGTFKTFEEALNNRSVEKVLRDLNWQENKKIVSQNSSLAAKKQSYSYDPLLSQKEYDDLSTLKTIGQIVTVGVGQENLYRYDVDFLSTLILLVCVAVSLFLIGLRLGTLMFDIVFTQLIAPIVISTSISAPDRAKRVFKNLLSSYLLFIIVFMLMKIYIWSVIYIRDTVSNYAAQIILIVSFAKVVMSTPAFLTKLLGVDSGPLSAIGTIMAISSASNMISQTGRLVKGTAGKVLHHSENAVDTGAHGLGKVGGTVVGAVAGGRAGFHEGREEGGGKGAAVRGALLGTVTGGYAAARNDRAVTGQSARQVGREAGIKHGKRNNIPDSDVPIVPPEQENRSEVTRSANSSSEDTAAPTESTPIIDNEDQTPRSNYSHDVSESSPEAPRGNLLDNSNIQGNNEGYAQTLQREERSHKKRILDDQTTNDKKE